MTEIQVEIVFCGVAISEPQNYKPDFPQYLLKEIVSFHVMTTDDATDQQKEIASFLAITTTRPASRLYSYPKKK
jgi:hypothetical protein